MSTLTTINKRSATSQATVVAYSSPLYPGSDGLTQLDGDETIGLGQSFLNVNAGTLDSVYCPAIKSLANPTSFVYVTIYAHSGTYGTSSIPTGSVLATSDNVVANSISTTLQTQTFTFSGSNRITLAANTKYVAVLNYTHGTASRGIITLVSVVDTSAGNASRTTDGIAWTAYSTQDWHMTVYTTTAVDSLIDSYSETHYNNAEPTGTAVGVTDWAIAFQNISTITLTGARILAGKAAAPTGTMVLTVYAHSGTFGSATAQPTGSALATSDTVDVSTFQKDTVGLTAFTFSGANQITLAANTNYFLSFHFNGGDGSNYVWVGIGAPGTDTGNVALSGNSGSTWTPFPKTTLSIPYYVYGTYGLTDTNKASVGTLTTVSKSTTTPTIASLSSASYSGVHSAYSGSSIAYAQSFKNLNFTTAFTTAKFYLSKTGSPSGNVTATLYLMTNSYGTTTNPTGTALVTSDAVDISTLTGSNVLTSFNFSNYYVMQPGVYYCIVVNYSGGNSSNCLNIGYALSSPDAGNYAFSSDLNLWTTQATTDLIYSVIGTYVPSTTKAL